MHAAEETRLMAFGMAVCIGSRHVHPSVMESIAGFDESRERDATRQIGDFWKEPEVWLD